MRANLAFRRDALELARAIQGYAVEVTLRGVIGRGDEVKIAARFVHRGDADDVVITRGEETGVATGRIHGIEVAPAVALAQPQETRPGFDPSHLIHDLHPSVVAIGEEDFGRAGDGVAGDDLVGVLEAIQLLEKDAPGIGGPLHARDVMIARIGIRVEPTRRPTRGIDDADLAGGVGLPDLGICEVGELGVEVVGIVDQREFAHAGGVELPIGDVPAVRAPPQAIAQAEFFFVHPIGGAVDGVRTAIGGQRSDAQVGQRLDIDVVLAHVRDAAPIRRERGEEHRRRSGRTTQLTEGAGLAVQDPVIAPGLFAPDALGVREDQEGFGVVTPRILLDLQRGVLTRRQEFLGRNEDLAPAGFRVIADDVLDLLGFRVPLEGLRDFQGRETLAVLQPMRRAPALGTELLGLTENTG